jgi:chorismate--pyruvate lyase
MFARKLSPTVQSWLLDQGSLTRRLMAFCPGQFSVNLLSQEWRRAEIDEAQLLGIGTRERVLLRQVQLLCDNRIQVYARSIMPLKTLSGKHRRLQYLGEKPLGGYLFANPSLKRNNHHLATIAGNNPLFETALSGSDQQCHQIWGRRSLFTIDHKPLLVSEFFLPELFEKYQYDNYKTA